MIPSCKKQGKEIGGEEEILKLWREYFKELLNRVDGQNDEYTVCPKIILLSKQK